MKISILIPCYNEEMTISKLVSKVKAVRLPGITKEIIVVDDGSYDNSVRILKKLHGIKLIRHKVNRGKGAAIRTAIENATGEIVIIQDADLEYDPRDFGKLLSPILEGRAKVVYGSRLKNYPLHLLGRKQTPLLTHYLGNKFLTQVTNILYGSSITDMETCYKVISKEVLDSFEMRSERFEFEPEITAKILKKGFKIAEVPIKVSVRGYNEGKKITWKDGFAALGALLKYRFID